MSHPVAPSPVFISACGVLRNLPGCVGKKGVFAKASWPQGKVDGARFHDEAPPEAQGVGFLGDESDAIGDGAPFADENEPGVHGCIGSVLVGGSGGAASRVEVGNLVEDQGAEKAQVTASTREDAVLAVGIPPSDAVLVLRTE